MQTAYNIKQLRPLNTANKFYVNFMLVIPLCTYKQVKKHISIRHNPSFFSEAVHYHPHMFQSKVLKTKVKNVNNFARYHKLCKECIMIS